MERRSVREREAIARKRKQLGELEATSEESVEPQVDEDPSSAPLIWGGASLLALVGAASAFEGGTGGHPSSPGGLPEPAPKPAPVNPSPPMAPDRVTPPPEPELDRTPPGPLALTPSGEGPDLYEVLHREPGASVRWRPVSKESKESEEPWRPLDANVLSIPPGQTVEIRQIDRAGNPGELTTFAAPDRALAPEIERETTAEPVTTVEPETDAGKRLGPVQKPEPLPRASLTAKLKNDTGRTPELQRDAVTSDATVQVEVIDRSAHALQYRIGTENWQPLEGDELRNDLFPGDGPKSVVIKALDAQGHVIGKEFGLDFVVDRTPPPHARLEAMDADGTKVNAQGRPWKEGLGTAYQRITSAQVQIVGVEPEGSWAYATGEPSGLLDPHRDMPASADRLPPTALKTGPNTVYFRTFDRAGNSSVEDDQSMIRDFFYLVPPTNTEFTLPPIIL